MLTRAEKKEIKEFWAKYICPLPDDTKVYKKYHDKETAIETTVKEILIDWHDEVPGWIEERLNTLKREGRIGTRFAVLQLTPF